MSVRATHARMEPTALTVSTVTPVPARQASVESTVKITLLIALRGTVLTGYGMSSVSQKISALALKIK